MDGFSNTKFVVLRRSVRTFLVSDNEHDLLQAVDVATEMYNNGDKDILVFTYTDENVSTKIVKLIQSYTGVVNKMVWRKS